VNSHPFFQRIEARLQEYRNRSIPPDAGELFQLLLASAEDSFRGSDVEHLLSAIRNLSEDPDGDPITIDHKSAVVIRTAIEATLAGCDARILASRAFERARDGNTDAEIAFNRRARVWADAFGMQTANCVAKAGGQNAFNAILEYVRFLTTESGPEPREWPYELRMQAVERVRVSVGSNSTGAAIEFLRSARANQFVKELWPRDLPPLSAITIPGRRG
jgi:hypothetical protein